MIDAPSPVVREFTCCRKKNGHVTNCPVLSLHEDGSYTIKDDFDGVVRLTGEQFDALVEGRTEVDKEHG